ncbi:MAG: hypothetical protein MUF64_17085 [Polyangiaceae bacterium]|nr:hypothetical protein [Polyangiaceae bacterium]
MTPQFQVAPVRLLTIAGARNMPASAIRLEEPLRTARGTSARGTVLYDPSALPQPQRCSAFDTFYRELAGDR